MAAVQLPQDEDGLEPAGEEVRAVRRKGQRRDGVSVPVQDAGRRRGHGALCRARAAAKDVVPQPDLTLCVARREVVLARVERNRRQDLVVTRGRDALREAALDVGRAGEVDRARVQAREDCAVGREGEGAHDARGREADAPRGLDGGRRVGGRDDAVDEVLCGAEGHEVDAGLAGGAGRGAEGDEELVGERSVGRGVEDRGAELEGAEEAALEVVPEADLAVCRGDDELARVGGGQEHCRDGGAAECGRGGGRRRRGRVGVGADREGRHELGRLDRVDLDGGARRDECIAVCR